MNQILVTESNNNQKNKGNQKYRQPMQNKDIKNIAKFFAIFIMIFGFVLSGNGTYAMLKNAEEKKKDKGQIVEVVKKGNVAEIRVKNPNGIHTVMYTWNNASSKVIQGHKKKEIVEEIAIPEGINNLNISVTDINQKMKKYVKVLKGDERDETEPTITLKVENTDIKIIVKDDTEIDCLKYEYGEEKKTIKAKGDKKTIEATIQVIPGTNKLKVEAIDKVGNIANQEKTIKGIDRPVVKVIQKENDSSKIIIKAEDEKGLRMISFIINEQEYQTDPNISLNSKKFEYTIQIPKGKCKVKVRAYNIDNNVTEYSNEFVN